MKNTISFFSNLALSTSAHVFFRTYVTSILFALVTLTSCSSDDEIDNSADIAKLVGSYSVVDTDEDGDVENYSIHITKGKDGGVEVSTSEI